MAGSITEFSPLLKPKYRTFLLHFYAVSDKPDAHEEYADLFSEYPSLQMASSIAVGREGTSKGMFRFLNVT